MSYTHTFHDGLDLIVFTRAYNVYAFRFIHHEIKLHLSCSMCGNALNMPPSINLEYVNMINHPTELLCFSFQVLYINDS